MLFLGGTATIYVLLLEGTATYFASAHASAAVSGTYVLGIFVATPIDLEVGALGTLAFDAGRYAYVGGAFGPGGFARVTRHRELARGERETTHWHVDYLLCHPETALDRAVTFPGADRECELARTLPGTPVDGFGASDCDCPGHLLATRGSDRPLEAVTRAGGTLERFVE